MCRESGKRYPPFGGKKQSLCSMNDVRMALYKLGDCFFTITKTNNWLNKVHTAQTKDEICECISSAEVETKTEKTLKTTYQLKVGVRLSVRLAIR